MFDLACESGVNWNGTAARAAREGSPAPIAHGRDVRPGRVVFMTFAVVAIVFCNVTELIGLRR